MEAEQLQKELEILAGQLQAQVKDNEGLSRLNQEQEQRLLELERASECWENQVEERKKILETMQNDRTTISRALSQNRELKQQLAELQDGFVKLVCSPSLAKPFGPGWDTEPLWASVSPAIMGFGWGVRTPCDTVPVKARCEPEWLTEPRAADVMFWGPRCSGWPLTLPLCPVQ